MADKGVMSYRPLLYVIFKNLGAKDLSRCAQVCCLWRDVAEEVTNKRPKNAHTFSKFDGKAAHKFTCFNYFDCFFDDIGPSIPKPLAILKEELENAPSPPALCIAVMCPLLFSYLKELCPDLKPQNSFRRFKLKKWYYSSREYLHSVLKSTLKRHLPKNCITLLNVTPCFVDYNFKKPCLPLFNGLVVPRIPGLHIHHAPIRRRRRTAALSAILGHADNLKCLLVFLARWPSDYTDDISEVCKVLQRDGLAVGGCVVHRSESLLGSVVGFCGPSVDAASMMIDNKDDQNAVRKKLEEFGKSGLVGSDRRCFALLFDEWRDSTSELFKEMYPGVPLLGNFGLNVRFGTDYMPGTPYVKRDDFFVTGVRVFVLVSVRV